MKNKKSIDKMTELEEKLKEYTYNPSDDKRNDLIKYMIINRISKIKFEDPKTKIKIRIKIKER